VFFIFKIHKVLSLSVFKILTGSLVQISEDKHFYAVFKFCLNTCMILHTVMQKSFKNINKQQSYKFSLFNTISL